MITKNLMVGLVTTVSVAASACAISGGDGCTTDADCKGARVCSSGMCVYADGGGTVQNDSGTAPSEAGADTGTPPPTCDPVGTTCTTTSSCCQSGSGIGAAGAICISNDNLCHAACTTDAQCTSGCCAPVQGETLGVCADSSECAPTCTAPGGACTMTSQCCQTGATIPYGATCLTDDYTCHDICYASSECTSGCCIELQGLSYGACGSAAGHVCL